MTDLIKQIYDIMDALKHDLFFATDHSEVLDIVDSYKLQIEQAITDYWVAGFGEPEDYELEA